MFKMVRYKQPAIVFLGNEVQLKPDISTNSLQKRVKDFQFMIKCDAYMYYYLIFFTNIIRKLIRKKE